MRRGPLFCLSQKYLGEKKDFPVVRDFVERTSLPHKPTNSYLHFRPFTLVPALLQPYSSLTLALLMSKAAVWLQYGCNEARRSLRGDWKQTVEVEKWVGTGYSPLLVPEAFAGSCSCATAATVFQICVTCYACYCTFTKYAHCLQLNNYDCWLVICFFHNR